MAILIVDDSRTNLQLVTMILCRAGYEDLITAPSAAEARKLLRKREPGELELALLDILMPDESGIEFCRNLKEEPEYHDVPIIMITGLKDEEVMQEAFNAGAMDYITKPPRPMELMARMRSALALSAEMERRKLREEELLEITKELEVLNRKLQALSLRDGLTGTANRRMFDEAFRREWRRCVRNAKPLSLILIDIDFFKRYNDHYGHLQGDESLKAIAGALQRHAQRAGDLAARYGGEEFVMLLPETPLSGAKSLAESVQETIAALSLPHATSEICGQVTVSMGVASVVPTSDVSPESLIDAADQAMYAAKGAGRNRVVTQSYVESP